MLNNAMQCGEIAIKSKLLVNDKHLWFLKQETTKTIIYGKYVSINLQH